MKRLLCLLGLHDWRTLQVTRYCACPWPDVEQDARVVEPGRPEDAWCDASISQACTRCAAPRRLWARRLTPDNVPAWAHARMRGGEQ